MKVIILATVVILLTGCASAGPIDMITPTIVPPLSDQLGYHVPNVNGVTTVGIVKGVLIVEKLRLEALDASASATIRATNESVNGLLSLLATLGLTGTAALPLALRKTPKGAVSKKDHYRDVEIALKTPVA